MSNIITAGNATNNGTSISSDTSGVLELKTGSTPTTALTIGTSGQVGVGSTPSYGTSGQVLTSSGSGAAPTWATASGGITQTTGSAPYYGARAWVSFNGVGTVSIRASANVSSITDNDVGQYTVNFTTAMPDANYCFQVNAQDENNGMGVPTAQADPTRTITASALPVLYNYPLNQNYYDASIYTVAVFR